MKSFKSCGLNLLLDSRKDALIHCFKGNYVCSSGANKVKVLQIICDKSSDDDLLVIDEETDDVDIL